MILQEFLVSDLSAFRHARRERNANDPQGPKVRGFGVSM